MEQTATQISIITFVKTNFTPKNVIDFKKSQTTIEIAIWNKSNLFIRHNHLHE